MFKRFSFYSMTFLFAALLVYAVQFPAAGAAEKTAGVQLGTLLCKSQPGTRVQVFLRSSVAIKCTYKNSIGEDHQAFLPSPDELEDLKAGFLGQVRDGVFTPGEDVYSD